MASGSFLPGIAALRSDSVGDDAGENEDHPDDNQQMSEVLVGWEARVELVVNVVDEGVDDEIGEQADRDDGGAHLCQARHGQATGGGSD
jgi:hypothetical protein